MRPLDVDQSLGLIAIFSRWGAIGVNPGNGRRRHGEFHIEGGYRGVQIIRIFDDSETVAATAIDGAANGRCLIVKIPEVLGTESRLRDGWAGDRRLATRRIESHGLGCGPRLNRRGGDPRPVAEVVESLDR